MESRFVKQATTYCRLDFSNSIFKKPKALFYSRNIPQQPINFREKNLKKSLKNVIAECINNERKHPQTQCRQYKKESLKRPNGNRTIENHLSNQKSRTKVKYQNRGIKYLLDSNTLIKSKVHQSLQRQPIRMQSKRNIIEDLKNYQYKKNPDFTRHEHISTFQSPKNYICMPSRNLIQMNPSTQSNFANEEKIKMISPFFRQKKQEQQLKLFSQSMKSLEKIKLIPTKRTIDKQEFLQKQVFVIQKQKKKYQQPVTLIQHNKPKQLVDKSEYTQKFQQLFGQIQIEDEIKHDLVMSNEFRKIKSQNDGVNIKNSRLNKLAQSESSTIIPQQNKLKMNNSSASAQLNNLIRSSKCQQQSNTDLKGLNQQDDQQSNSQKHKTQQKYNARHQNNPEAESQYSIDIIDSVQFHDRYQRPDNFKRIVSIHSESGSSSSEANSIIIDNHPQQLISSKPIRTLF